MARKVVLLTTQLARGVFGGAVQGRVAGAIACDHRSQILSELQALVRKQFFGLEKAGERACVLALEGLDEVGCRH